MKKLFAFTLTEIMIAVAIIGVISAMTVPTLVNNYQKNAYIVQLRKVINDIVSAADLYITENGKQDLSQIIYKNNGQYLEEEIDKFVTSKLKVIKTCDSDETGCFASEKYISIDGSQEVDIADYFNENVNLKQYVLANSAAIYLEPDIVPGNNNKIRLKIIIDTNGADGPNIGGRDTFIMYLNPDLTFRDTGNLYYCSDSAIGKNCLYTLMQDGWKMKY